MTKAIKNGPKVEADVTYKADVRVEKGNIIEIRPTLAGAAALMQHARHD